MAAFLVFNGVKVARPTCMLLNGIEPAAPKEIVQITEFIGFMSRRPAVAGIPTADVKFT